MGNELSFEELISTARWRSFEDHAKQIDIEMTRDIDVVISQNKVVRDEARKLLHEEADARATHVSSAY